MSDTDFEGLSATEEAQIQDTPAAPEPAKQPEPVVETPEPVQEGTEQPEGGDRTKMVPHQALHEARQQAKEARQRAEQAEQARIREQQRFDTIIQKLTPAQQAEQRQPTVQDDPLAVLDNIQREFQAERQAREQAAAQTQRFQGLSQAVASYEVPFKETTPDYDQAVAFVRQSRDQELQTLGYTDPMLRRNIIQQEAIGTAHQMLTAGKNPAETIYALAKSRGYQPPGSQTEGADRMAQLQRGAQASRSIGGAAAAPNGIPTAQAVASMTDSEWDAFEKSDPDGSKFRKLFGG